MKTAVCFAAPLVVAAVAGANLAPASPKPAPIATVYVFLATDCPVASRMVPQIARLAKAYRKRGVNFVAVYPNETETLAGIKHHAKERGLTGAAPVVLDANGRLARTFAATMTPQAVIVGTKNAVLYRGNVAELAGALNAVAAKKPVPAPKTAVVGCALRLRVLPIPLTPFQIGRAHV